MRLPELILVPVLVLDLTAAGAAGLPDTGLDLCDDGNNILVACTAGNTGDGAAFPRQDGRFGRDAKAKARTLATIGGGAAGFDYSKIANNGGDLGAGIGLEAGTNPADWACTRDNITGLTWEVKVNDSTHLRHVNWTYSWYNSEGSTNGGTPGTASGTANCKTTERCDTEKFVAEVNAAALCTYTDWRMPTQRELLTLVHRGMQNPSIDATYFPNTNSSVFWSGSSYVANPSVAWFVYFSDGGSDAGDKAGVYFVRLVRGVQF